MLDDVISTVKHFIFYSMRIGIVWWLIAFATGLAFAAAYKHTHKEEALDKLRLAGAGLFGTYLIVLFAAAVFTRTPKEEMVGVNIDLMGTIVSRLSVGSGPRTEILFNSVMLVPAGFLIPFAFGLSFSRTLAVSFSTVLCIELMELLGKRGYFELSDIILNMLGVLMGYGAYRLFVHWCGKSEKEDVRDISTFAQHLVPRAGGHDARLEDSPVLSLIAEFGWGALVILYLTLKPLYFMRSGSIQLADLLLVAGTLCMTKSIITSSVWDSRKLCSVVFLFAILCVYQALVNTIWSRALGMSILKPTLYYVFNLIAFVDVLAISKQIGKKRVIQCLSIGAIGSFATVVIGELINRGDLFSTSFFNNPNQLGFHCLILMAIVLFCREEIPAPAFWALMVGPSIELYLSASRAAVVGWAMLVILYTLFGRSCTNVRSVIARIGFLACVAVVLYIAVWSDFSPLASNTQLANLREQFSLQVLSYDKLFGSGRGYNRMFEMGRNLLWGMGEGAYWRFRSLSGMEVHCTYVALLVSYGLIGFVGYVTLFVKCVWAKGRTWQTNLLPLTGVLVYQLVHNGIRNTLVWMLLAAMLYCNAVAQDIDDAYSVELVYDSTEKKDKRC